jgi:hypothetical protein
MGEMTWPPPDVNFIVPKRTPSVLLMRFSMTRLAMLIFDSVQGGVVQTAN